MTKKKHDTPLLDQLESGPWPSFVSGLKRLADDKGKPYAGMMNDLLGQLEHSYETRLGYWKGGTVSVFGYGGGVIPRFSEVAEEYPGIQGIPYPARNAAGRHALQHRYAPQDVRHMGGARFRPDRPAWAERRHHVPGRHHRKRAEGFRRLERPGGRPRYGRRRPGPAHLDFLRRPCPLRAFLL